MSCNPAIGGLGKGHLVREVDALDGLMGRVADRAGIQFRLLNRRKGPAVQGPRAQCDRGLYRHFMQHEIAAHPRIQVIEGEVVDLLTEVDAVGGVVLADASIVPAAAVILTTGTFLGGMIHLGLESRPAGRLGDPAALRLAGRIRDFGLEIGRLKTGTPPRLARGSIDFARLAVQPGDAEPVPFSFLDAGLRARQVPCHIARTNQTTHDIIQTNLRRSAMYSGRIRSTGPRYCPSIEDKVVRFAEKQEHQIFLEPEGLESDLIYPNGISTSLPVEVQSEFIRSIKGLDRAEIAQPGYAIEYDFVDPRSLDRRLAVRDVAGLFLAGQINGTTGYEEAAAQGVMAGIHAAAAVLGRSAPVFDRADGYLGVLVDDLVTHGVTEPYRMFTSRAEYRLSLRADNADQRLTPIGLQTGCVGPGREQAFYAKMGRLDGGRRALRELSVTPDEACAQGLAVNRDGVRRTGLELVAYPDISVAALAGLDGRIARIDAETAAQIERECAYASYTVRQQRDVEAMRREEGHRLSADIDYLSLAGLSSELRRKLAQSRPETLGQASRIEGMTPAALALLLAVSRRKAERKRA